MRRVGLTPKQRLQAGNPKFHAGKNPLELEANLDVIQPTDAAQQKQLSAMVEKMYEQSSGDPAIRNGLALWKTQMATGAMSDQVKLQFLRRFYFWLLGRGTEDDTKKTMWGRGNAAVHNKEVAAYIEQFSRKRTEYAMQLALMADRVPETLNGYYLYYKYIVNGNLKRSKDNKGKEWWDLSQDDYLEDFDLFQKEFDTRTDKPRYSEVIAPAADRSASQPAFRGVEPFPATAKEREQHRLQGEQAQDDIAYDQVNERFKVTPQSRKAGPYQRHPEEPSTTNHPADAAPPEAAPGPDDADPVEMAVDEPGFAIEMTDDPVQRDVDDATAALQAQKDAAEARVAELEAERAKEAEAKAKAEQEARVEQERQAREESERQANIERERRATLERELAETKAQAARDLAEVETRARLEEERKQNLVAEKLREERVQAEAQAEIDKEEAVRERVAVEERIRADEERKRNLVVEQLREERVQAEAQAEMERADAVRRQVEIEQQSRAEAERRVNMLTEQLRGIQMRGGEMLEEQERKLNLERAARQDLEQRAAVLAQQLAATQAASQHQAQRAYMSGLQEAGGKVQEAYTAGQRQQFEAGMPIVQAAQEHAAREHERAQQAEANAQMAAYARKMEVAQLQAGHALTKEQLTRAEADAKKWKEDSDYLRQPSQEDSMLEPDRVTPRPEEFLDLHKRVRQTTEELAEYDKTARAEEYELLQMPESDHEQRLLWGKLSKELTRVYEALQQHKVEASRKKRRGGPRPG